MPTNLEFIARERQRKRESGPGESQREKGRQGFRARERKNNMKIL